MVKDGLVDEFPCGAIFGSHNRPGLAIGKFQIRPGAMMAGGAFFDIAITGRGAHGARPEAGVDPVLVGSHITTALQSIVARNVRAVDTAVVSVTQIHAGDAYNVIPERAVLRGTVRCCRTMQCRAMRAWNAWNWSPRSRKALCCCISAATGASRRVRCSPARRARNFAPSRCAEAWGCPSHARSFEYSTGAKVRSAACRAWAALC